MTDEHWHCEMCNDVQTGEPAAMETVVGLEGPVELWYCENCTRAEQ